MRILLVDDEVRLLDSFRRSLRVARPEWEVTTADSGQEALRCLGGIAYDVLVTDMQMPAMDGATVLREARRIAPGTARILLSGHAGRDRILASEGAFHQFLAKPVAPGALQAMLDALDQDQRPPEAVQARRWVAGLERLPSLPCWHDAMEAQLQRENASFDEVAAIIRQDMGLASKVLKLVNSPYLAKEEKLTDLTRATEYLSLDLLKAAVLRHGISGSAESVMPSGLDLAFLWRHSQEVATAARFLAQRFGSGAKEAEACYSAGLLHDLGRLVLALDATCGYQAVLAQPETLICRTEWNHYRTDHSQIGAELLLLWGLDATLAEAVRSHHQYATGPDATRFSLQRALQVADVWSAGQAAMRHFPDGCLDRKTLEGLYPGDAPTWFSALDEARPLPSPIEH